VHHGKVHIARANREAIQKILPTRNLWRGLPQDAGAAVCLKNQSNEGGAKMAGQMFLRVEEVAEQLDVSTAYAYKLIRDMNAELKKTGCITISGRIDKKFFYEKFYGTRDHKEGRL
jgi:hypothetical protein